VLGSIHLPYDANEPPPSKEMVSLIQYCSNNKLPLIIGCDANSHHPCWGSTDRNDRGNALLEYLVTTDLTILNKGTKPTFVVTRRQTVIEITLASSDAVSLVTGRRLSDEESLSDHRYIKFQVRSESRMIRGAFKKFCNFYIKKNHKLTNILSFLNIVSCNINAVLSVFC